MIKFHIIESGYFRGDGGVMFGCVPKKHWSRLYKCDDDNMCDMAMRCLFIEADDRRIVVDSGLGDKHLSKVKFYQPYQLKNLVCEIRNIGYEPEEITDVIFTHLHFDHCGGTTIIGERGDVVPAFPNATHWLSRAQWDNYREPSLFEAASFFSDNIEPIFEAGLLHFVETDIDLFDDFRLELYDGHTPGQIVLFFKTDEGDFIFPGDLVPTSLNRSLGWLCGYDNSPAIAMSEKKRFFDKIKDRDCTLIFYHDAYTQMSKMK